MSLDIETLFVDPYDEKRAKAPEDLAVSGALFARILALVGIGLLACTVWAFGLTDSQMGDGLSLSSCAAITNDGARLACFDTLAVPRPPARGAFAILDTNPHEESQ